MTKYIKKGNILQTINIRKSVFETNSSSSHSLSIAYDGALNDIPKSNTVYIDFGEYGWEYKNYYDFSDKLSYLMTSIAQSVSSYEPNPDKEYFEVIFERIRATDYFDMLEKVLTKHGITNIHFPDTDDMNDMYNLGYVDHESSYLFTDCFTDEKTLEQFLFSTHSVLTTDNDNH